MYTSDSQVMGREGTGSVLYPPGRSPYGVPAGRSEVWEPPTKSPPGSHTSLLALVGDLFRVVEQNLMSSYLLLDPALFS